YLSGYDLDDPLPDFSQMDDALEAIDLRNNHLDGPIPDVLGKLLNLTLLDLRDNNFAGGVPIGSSKNQSESKRLALIIVLAVGLPIFFLFILALVFLLVRKQKTSTQVQVTAVELGGNRVTTTGQWLGTNPDIWRIHTNEGIGAMPTAEEMSMGANAGSINHHYPTTIQMIDE
ncbi:hypothetical protein V6Z11_D05G102500, partial [Gossypium hirsutum]